MASRITTQFSAMNIEERRNNIQILFLDAEKQEAEMLRNYFDNNESLKGIPINHFKDPQECNEYIENVSRGTKMILISSGSLVGRVIDNALSMIQLQAIYIYCRRPDRYYDLKKNNEKILDIIENRDALWKTVAGYLGMQVQPASVDPEKLSRIVAENKTPPKHDWGPVDENTESFAQPGIHWCPWNAQSCHKALPVKGQGTIQLMQLESVPFEILLSDASAPNTRGSFGILLQVDNQRASLSIDGSVFGESTAEQHVIQPANGHWHTYWLSFFSKTGTVRYGIGETRPYFSIFEIKVNDDVGTKLANIQFLHAKFNNDDEMLRSMQEQKERFRFFIGKDPVVDEAALLVGREISNILELTQRRLVSYSRLAKPCRQLFDCVKDLTLTDPEIPNFAEAVQRSIDDPTGWCHQKLNEKAESFGKSKKQATYLRITCGNLDGSAPGHKFVLEIWPSGHYSPIHNHANCYAIVKVLSGHVLVKLYPELSLKVRQYHPIETILKEGEVTWMLPRLNQTHQLSNPDSNGKCAITIQCYQYGEEDKDHYEYFDYLNNEGQEIEKFDPVSDMDYDEFRRILKDEWKKQNKS